MAFLKEFDCLQAGPGVQAVDKGLVAGTTLQHLNRTAENYQSWASRQYFAQQDTELAQELKPKP